MQELKNKRLVSRVFAFSFLFVFALNVEVLEFKVKVKKMTRFKFTNKEAEIYDVFEHDSESKPVDYRVTELL